MTDYLAASEWRYLPKGTALRHILLQHVTACNSVEQPVTESNSVLQDVTSPSPARARDTISSPTTNKSSAPSKESEPAPEPKQDAVQSLAALFARLDWYGAKFTGSSTEEALAAKLIDTYPNANHHQNAKDASAWLFANPKQRKKQAARFLLGWWKRSLVKPKWEQDQLDLRDRPNFDPNADPFYEDL